MFRHPPDTEEIGRLLKSVEQFPESAHLIGAYALGKAQRVMRLVRETGYEQSDLYPRRACQAQRLLPETQASISATFRPATVESGSKGDFAGAVVIGPPSAFADRWSRRFPEPISCYASGWMRIRQRAKQLGVELPLIISDHSDWDELTATILETGASEVWVTHGREEALVRWCELSGIAARPLHLVGYEDEGD